MGEKNFTFIKTLLQKEIEKGSMNGSSIRIIHNNAIIYEDVFGYANKEDGIRMQKDSIFRLYSMTKPITATAVMILYERGLIDLFDPVYEYLYGFHNQKVWTEDGLVDCKRPVTIFDLLNMTSGIIYPSTDSEVGRQMEKLLNEVARRFDQGEKVGTVEFSNIIGKLPLKFQPGEEWEYGMSADILGAVIEVVSGKKFGQFLEEEIFKPLGMIDTGFYISEDKLDRIALLYEYIEEKDKLELCNWSKCGIGNTWPNPDFESGGGGLVSTIEDYSIFSMMLANGGIYNNVRILGTKTVEYMSMPQLNDNLLAYFDYEKESRWYRNGYSYGTLMKSMINPAKAGSNGSIGEFGWEGWCGNSFFVNPKENLIMIYLVQKCDGIDMSLIRKLRSIIYSSIN